MGSELEKYFQTFRENIIGVDKTFQTPYGEKQMLYADWVASGRLYRPIEEKMAELVFPFCGNTHTETSITGTLMTNAYQEAKNIVKRELGGHEEDVLIFEGSGMTAVINKLQRMLGLRIPEQAKNFIRLEEKGLKPIVFVTHMEHHSNQTSWLETLADVEIINPNAAGEVDLNHFADLLKQYHNRPLKIASVTASSNVTGVMVPYYTIAEMIHDAGGYCFVDFACSGPYVDINMHPENPKQQLDAVFVSPHKFLGGPGTSGVMVFNKCLYKNNIPDHSGGGTVKFTTPWKFHEYVDNIESREDGGTPAFLQGIKTALCFLLKKEMNPERMMQREKELLTRVFEGLGKIPNLKILQDNITHRIGAVSFYIEGLHYNLGVKLLNDLFGIQVRGGCACAGTYGHYLLNISQEQSQDIYNHIQNGDLFARPGWIRLSVHPTFTNEEIEYIIESIAFVAAKFTELSDDYTYQPKKNIFVHKTYQDQLSENWLDMIYRQKELKEV